MKSDSGATSSVWMATTPPISSDGTLQQSMAADVCIVGAGISGLTIAYLLAREGKRVVVLDDGPIGGGMTGRTTAHLVTALDDRFYEIERLQGERGARLAAESHSAAIDRVEWIISTERIDCEFERLDGYLFVPPGESTEPIERELAAAHRAGLTDVEMIARAPIKDFDTGRCLRFPRQAQFHPLKYLAGLAATIRKGAGRIHTGTHATAIEGGTRARVTTGGGQVITAESVVVATNTPINDLVVMHTKQGAYITYVIGARVPRGSVTKALFWDTPDPYHYVRLESVKDDGNGHDVLIVGGEDHKTGQADDADERFARLETWTRTRFPMIESIEYRWSGQVMEPIDSLAFIGKNPMDENNVFIVTGDSGNGMTHGTIAGMLLTDLIIGRKNEWASLYDPARKTLQALPEFASENVNVAAQYVEVVTPGDVESVEQIARGDGAIIRRGLKKSRCIATLKADCMNFRRSACIWGASWPGTRRKRRGIARATAHGSTPMAKCFRDQLIAISRRRRTRSDSRCPTQVRPSPSSQCESKVVARRESSFPDSVRRFPHGWCRCVAARFVAQS